MEIRPIKTEEDYDAALVEIERLFAAVPGTAEADRLDVLTTLVQAYEAKHHPIGPPDPISAIEYEMEKRGLTRQDLETVIGPSERVNEVLNRQRPLTMAMIRRLHTAYRLSPDVLIAPYPLTKAPQTRKSTRRDEHTTKSKRQVPQAKA